MVRRISETLLVSPEHISPSRDDFEVIGVFNPGAVPVGDNVILLVRVAERPCERRDGLLALPRHQPQTGVVVDWVSENAWEWLDPRVVRSRENGLVRLTFLSHLRALTSRDGRSFEAAELGRLEPLEAWEEFGVEDARITPIADTFYFTYVAVSRHGAATALASTTDFKTFQRHGIIFCPENKDVLLFPEKIAGRYGALHRPTTATPFSAPEIWLARSDDLLHWGSHEPLLGGEFAWEGGRIGGGTPPVRTDEGWLEIYHGSKRPGRAGEVGVYSAGALMMDLEQPSRILARSQEPILFPQATFERDGFLPNVVFPTGIVARKDRFQIYYGAADTFTAMVELPRDELIGSMGRIN